MKRIVLSLFLLVLIPVFGQGNEAPKNPKLVVGIVIDQMRYEYLYRFYNDFGDDGFKKLMRDGMNCRNTNYNYVPTYTGPGHASIYTGTTPANHGIVANSWYSKEEGKLVNCVEDASVTPVQGTDAYGKFSPTRLKTNTITDQLKLTDRESKVISVSLKNRGAILPGGHMSDGSYWFDYSNGKFITSSFFKDAMPNWVKSFNDKAYPKKDLTRTWDLMLDSSNYTESRVDDYAYEVTLPGKEKPVFPYDFSEMMKGQTDFEMFGFTPYSNTTLLRLAKAGVKNESLGEDEHTDFLNVSISATDIIGHAFGPYSREIQDTYIRLDKDLADFLTFLDEEVGEGEYLLFLTADHAVEPIPQYLMDHKLMANYFDVSDFKKALEKHITSNFDVDTNSVISAIKNQQIYLDDQLMIERKVDRDVLIKSMKSFIFTQKGVKNVFLKSDLLMSNQLNELNELINKGIHHRESGDLIFMLEPGYLAVGGHTKEHKEGTSHGSPYGYDTDVPLLWYGWTTPTKEVLRKVNITDITATLQRILNLPKANGCTGKVIVEYFD